uniref:Death-associated protein 1-like n=1 Tax=Ciona intestinalis TaxID=7719 RepID=H2XWX4_CIOIN|nr:death-associated protein 1-like [Ciona intestinalis]|eukprot:XP_002130753.1 death-associated protein 1-like [Ciona intestinalis]
MSSPTKENDELKAGHPPAVKAGGMRIKGARAHEEKLTKEETESPWESEGPKPQQTNVIISGAVTHGDKDFTPASVQVAHQKPLPTVPKPVTNKQINRQIQQPR